MKKVIPMFLFSALLFSCDSDDDVIDNGFQGETKEYTINALTDASIEGNLSFTENEDGSTTIEIELDGTEEGQEYPAYLRHDSAAEDGEVAITLEPVEGATGTSTTTLSVLDDETTISYEELADFDGHLSIVIPGEEDSETLVAVADVGENQLTGEAVSLNLQAVGDQEISGTATFEERENGETLVSLQLEGTEPGNTLPAQILVGSIDEATNEIAIQLNPVDGAKGSSHTQVAALDEDAQDGEAIDYEALTNYDGHLVIYLSEEDMETVVAQGNIVEEETEE